LSQRAQSSRITAARRSGGWSQLSSPLFAKRSASPGVRIACVAAPRSFANASGGVPFSANSAIQDE
jgi:hypothetical protein